MRDEEVKDRGMWMDGHGIVTMHKDLCIGINTTRKHLPSRQNDSIGFPSAGLICIDGVVLVAGVEATYGPKSIGSYSQRLTPVTVIY